MKTTKRNDTQEANISIRQILKTDCPDAPEPKKDGAIPAIGTKVQLFEKRFMARKSSFVNIGEYKIVNSTKFLVVCDKVSKNGTVYSTSFKISDFRSGLIIFSDVNTNTNNLSVAN